MEYSEISSQTRKVAGHIWIILSLLMFAVTNPSSAWQLEVISPSNHTANLIINCSTGLSNLTQTETSLCEMFSTVCRHHALCSVHMIKEDNSPISQPVMPPIDSSANDSGMGPGYIAAIVLCVVLAIGIIALIIVLYAYNQRQKSYMNTLERHKAKEMSRSASKATIISYDFEKQQGEVNAAFESEVPSDGGTYYTTVATDTYPHIYAAIIKGEQDTVLNSAPPALSDDSQLKTSGELASSQSDKQVEEEAENNNTMTDQGFVESPCDSTTSQQDLYEPVEVSEADSKINMRDVSTRKLQLQKKTSKDNLYSTSPAADKPSAFRQDTLYDEPWDSNHDSMLSAVMDSMIHNQRYIDTQQLSPVVEEENTTASTKG